MDLLQLILAALLGCAATVIFYQSIKADGAIQTYPASHVSFDHSASDEERLKLLDETRMAVLDGRLSQTNQLKNDGTTDQAAEPGAKFEN